MSKSTENNHLICQLHSIEELTPVVFQVRLALPEPIDFKAGQYITVVMGDDDYRAFSIASSPCQQAYLELHIGVAGNNLYAIEVLDRLKQEGQLVLTRPLGDAYARDNEHGIILVAGGTGFSYTWSIAQAELAKGHTRPIYFYWGAKTLEELYAHEELLDLAQEHPHFHYCPVLEHPPEDWHCDRGYVHLAACQGIDDLSHFYVYMAGRPEMVMAARHDFYHHGLPLHQLYSDALSYLPPFVG